MASQPLPNVFVAGHRGMVGSAVVRALEASGTGHTVVCDRELLDLRSPVQVADFYASNRIDIVVIAAAKVGGIHANQTYPADFLFDNLMIQANLIHGAHNHGVQRLLFLGSSCIYPRDARQPITEDCLLAGKLESTNEPYAIAKIAGIKLCESFNRQFDRDYRSLMPTNLYGPGDNFHLENSHVIPALIRKFHEAALSKADHVVVWGSGKPMREFLHVDDLADACLHALATPRDDWNAAVDPMASHVNVGTGVDCSIRQLAETIADVTSFRGHIVFDSEKPDGTPRKLLDVAKMTALGWQARIGLNDGLRRTYDWFLARGGDVRQ
jgi:GDP-L-fucose synthase